MKRILVIGSSGAGKSQLALSMGEALGIEVIHLDKEHWRPRWTEPPKDEWRRRVEELVTRDEWIIDGNFGGTMDIRISAADTVVFLDLPRTLCVWRTIKRVIKYRKGTRPDMAEGCDEKLDLMFLKWIWDFPNRTRPKILSRLAEAKGEKTILRLGSRREVAEFLKDLRDGRAAAPSEQYKNICILHFGQLGDVLLALPAINAIRKKFGKAKITLIAGNLPAQLADELRIVDEVVAVDRVALLRGNKIRSIRKILKLVGDVRRRRFDFVIDLHSLYETNLLGFLSGAAARLYSNRENRSLDRLGNFKPRPPLEDKTIHLADNYLAVLRPLGIENGDRYVRIEPDHAAADALAKRFGLDHERDVIGMVVGAGHPSRRWPIGNFAELARRLVEEENVHIAVFLGPEEEHEASEIQRIFPAGTKVVSGLRLIELASIFSKVDLLVSNDTGPPHLAALVGTQIVLIIDERGPLRYLPLSRNIEVVRSGLIEDIPVGDVSDAVERSLAKKRTKEEKEPEEYEAHQRQQH
jgi:ADP-heptose:LPS heptosyltransferase/adenylate kinase family enzyme